MRRLFITMFALTIGTDVGSFFALPAKVAIHFGAAGDANRWASREFNLLLSLCLHLFLFGLIMALPALIDRTPARWVNLPNRDYWLAPENRSRTRAKIVTLMSEFGIALFGFQLGVSLLVVRANLSAPAALNLTVFFCLLAAFLAITAGWCIQLHRAFRIPAGSGGTP